MKRVADLGATKMPTTFRNAVNKYFRARNLKPGTRGEYLTTVAKWQKWNGGVTIERLDRSTIRQFLSWVHDNAVEKGGSNPGRTANKARTHLRAVMSWAWENDLLEVPPRFPKPVPYREVVGGIIYRHYAHRAPLAFKAIMTIPQPSAFMSLVRGFESQCPCCRRAFADAPNASS